MKLILPWDILKQGFSFLATRSGLLLVLVSFLFSCMFGIASLIVKSAILFPTFYVFQESMLLFWIILPILYIIFFIFLFVFAISAQFVMLFFLSRYKKNEEPFISLNALKQEKESFFLYIKTSFYTLTEILIGLLKGIFPGLKHMLNFFFIGPLIVFKGAQSFSVSDILNQANHAMEGHRQEFFYFLLLIIGIYILSLLMLKQLITQLLLVPFLFTYFSYCLVLYYQKVK